MKAKKFLAVLILAVLVAILSTMFVGCDEPNAIYYNTTYTLTGKGLAIDWDLKNQYDMNGKFPQDEKVSYRQLLEAYFDEIDWTYGLAEGTEPLIPTDVDQVISLLDARIEKGFESAKGMIFSFSDKDNLQLTIIYPEHLYLQPCTIKMAETTEKFNELYPILRAPEGSYQDVAIEYPNYGRSCQGAVPYVEFDGQTYDKVVYFYLTEPYYGSSDKQKTSIVTFDMYIPFVNGESTYFQQASQTISFWKQIDEYSFTSVVPIVVYPEVISVSTSSQG